MAENSSIEKVIMYHREG